MYYINRYLAGNIILEAADDGIYLLSAILLSTRAVIIGVLSVIILQNLYQLFWERRFFTIRRFAVRVLLALILFFTGTGIYNFWIQQDIKYTLDKFNQFAELDFRRRVPGGLVEISRFSILEHLVGAGENRFALTENDLVDIYGKFGILAISSLVIINLFFLMSDLRKVVVHRNQRSVVLAFCLIIYRGHAAVAGHALLTAPVNN